MASYSREIRYDFYAAGIMAMFGSYGAWRYFRHYSPQVARDAMAMYMMGGEL